MALHDHLLHPCSVFYTLHGRVAPFFLVCLRILSPEPEYMCVMLRNLNWRGLLTEPRKFPREVEISIFDPVTIANAAVAVLFEPTRRRKSAENRCQLALILE